MTQVGRRPEEPQAAQPIAVSHEGEANEARSLACIAPLACDRRRQRAFAQDRADIDRTQIIGNRELPKVLYIVPWKKPMPGDLSGRPLVSVLDEALAPVDRDVFRRQVRYDAQARSRARRPAAK